MSKLSENAYFHVLREWQKMVIFTDSYLTTTESYDNQTLLHGSTPYYYKLMQFVVRTFSNFRDMTCQSCAKIFFFAYSENDQILWFSQTHISHLQRATTAKLYHMVVPCSTTNWCSLRCVPFLAFEIGLVKVHQKRIFQKFCKNSFKE